MKKSTILYLTAGLIALGAPAYVLADDSSTTPPPEHKQATPEQKEHYQALLKAVGLTQEDVKDLTPKERRAKIKETADTKLAELQKKKDAGTLSEQETKDLAIIQKFEKRAQHAKAAAGSTDKKPDGQQ